MATENLTLIKRVRRARKKPLWGENRARGFFAACDFAGPRLREACARRGFAQTRILTDWPTVVGEALSEICRPVKINYRKAGADLGAVLVLWAEGARAPEVETMAPRIIERVNAFYGYRAVTRVKLTQAAPPPAPAPPSRKREIRPLSTGERTDIFRMVAPIESAALREALEKLGANIKGSTPVRGA